MGMASGIITNEWTGTEWNGHDTHDFDIDTDARSFDM